MTAILPDFSAQTAAQGTAAPAASGSALTPQLLAGVASFPALLGASLTPKSPAVAGDPGLDAVDFGLAEPSAGRLTGDPRDASVRETLALSLEIEPLPAQPVRLPLPFDPEPFASKRAGASDPDDEPDSETDTGKPSPAGGTLLPSELPAEVKAKLAGDASAIGLAGAIAAEVLQPGSRDHPLGMALREGGPIARVRGEGVDGVLSRRPADGASSPATGQPEPTESTEIPASAIVGKPQGKEVQPDPSADPKLARPQALRTTGEATEATADGDPAQLHARAVLATALRGEAVVSPSDAARNSGPQALRNFAQRGAPETAQATDSTQMQEPASERGKGGFKLPEVSRSASKSAQPLANPATAAAPSVQQTDIAQGTPQPQGPVNANTPTVMEARAEQRSPVQLEDTIAQLAEARETGRSARPELTVRHSEFGAINMRIEAMGSDLRATLSARDPGFVPAIQAALADRAVAASSDTASSHSQRGHDQSSSQQQSQNSSSFAGGQSEARYGSSTGSGHASPQPYRDQNGVNEEEVPAQGRAGRSGAPRGDRGNSGLFA